MSIGDASKIHDGGNGDKNYCRLSKFKLKSWILHLFTSFVMYLRW